MLLEDNPEAEDLLLTNADFPSNFVDFAHPQDYIASSEPVNERIYHSTFGHHHRLLWRVSWKLGGAFYPFTFVLDTGSPKFMYLGKPGMDLLQSLGAAWEDQETGIFITKIAGRACPLEPTPEPHAPANIIGLQLLKRWKLALLDSPPHFSFSPELPVLEPYAERDEICISELAIPKTKAATLAATSTSSSSSNTATATSAMSAMYATQGTRVGRTGMDSDDEATAAKAQKKKEQRGTQAGAATKIDSTEPKSKKGGKKKGKKSHQQSDSESSEEVDDAPKRVQWAPEDLVDRIKEELADGEDDQDMETKKKVKKKKQIEAPIQPHLLPKPKPRAQPRPKKKKKENPDDPDTPSSESDREAFLSAKEKKRLKPKRRGSDTSSEDSEVFHSDRDDDYKEYLDFYNDNNDYRGVKQKDVAKAEEGRDDLDENGPKDSERGVNEDQTEEPNDLEGDGVELSLEDKSPREYHREDGETREDSKQNNISASTGETLVKNARAARKKQKKKKNKTSAAAADSADDDGKDENSTVVEPKIENTE